MARNRACRICGCTEEDDCRQCIEKTGVACSWVTRDLCSTCYGCVDMGDPIPPRLAHQLHPERFANCQSSHREGCWGRVEACKRCGKRRCFAEGTTSISELCDECWSAVAHSEAYWPTIEAAELQSEMVADGEVPRPPWMDAENILPRHPATATVGGHHAH